MHNPSQTGSEQLPASIDAEQAVLGGLMLDNPRWDEVIVILSADDFFVTGHRVIFRTITVLANQSQPFDLITLTECIEREGGKERLEQLGGFAYLAELSKNTPSSANIIHYAVVVREKSQLRQLITVGRTLSTDAMHPKADISNITEQAEAQLFELAKQHRVLQQEAVSVIAAMESLMARLEQWQHLGGMTGTPTGFSELDKLTCGLQAGDLVLLAARPSMGKTALALSLCLGALSGSEEKTVQVFSLEMSTEQLMMRLLSMQSGVPLSHIRSGELDDHDWTRLSDALGMISLWDNRLLVDDCTLQTPATLRTRARRYVRKYGQPALIVVDYLQLMHTASSENRTQEIAEISRSLKALSKELGCPVLALSQLNRQVEGRADKRPNNGDLRDSGALEQDADLILLLYRDEVYHPDTQDKAQAEIIIGKQRQGPTGTVRLHFNASCTQFSDAQGRPS